MPFPKGYKESRFLDLAEKIVDGLVSQGILIDIGYLESHQLTKEELAKAISKAIYDNLTYGNLGTLTMRDNKGRISAKLYIFPDGTLADDSGLYHPEYHDEIRNPRVCLNCGKDFIATFDKQRFCDKCRPRGSTK